MIYCQLAELAENMYRISRKTYVTIFHYLAVALAEVDYFKTCGLFLLRHSVDYVLQTCFRALRHLVRFRMFDSFFFVCCVAL